MTTYYIAGPMTDLPDFNYPMFHEVEDALIAKFCTEMDGNKVLNPANNFGGDQTLPYEVYLTMTEFQVQQADVIVLLPGWRFSRGALREAAVARRADKAFMLACRINGSPRWKFMPVENDWSGLADLSTEQPKGVEAEARELVYDGARAQTYGHPRGDFDRVAGMWSAILGVTVTAEQVAVMMVAFKLARLAQTPSHRDTQVDVIGYILCLERLLSGA